MQKIIRVSLVLAFLCLSLVFLISAPTTAQEPTPPAPKESEPPPVSIERGLLARIEPRLLKKVFEAKDQWVPFIVYLKPQADLVAATASAGGLSGQAQADPLAKRAAVVYALQQVARNSQAGVLQVLGQAASGSGLTGQGVGAAEIKPLWVINAVAAKGSWETVLALASRPEVEMIRLDRTIKISRPTPGPFPGPENQALIPHLAPQWNITKIRADLVHEALGIDGAGVVVANIDTGVDWLHPALQSGYRGYSGPGKLPVHPGNWFDTTGGEAAYPIDGDGHGTHTMGTMVGGSGLGVAPGARWIAVKAFDKTGSAQNSWIHEAFQWILAPNGNPALAPDVVNNSWSNTNGFLTDFEEDIEALLAAGIYPVFSTGNEGPELGTVGSPASLDIAFSVGATTLDDEVASFSSRGPSPGGKIKPEVSAPGKAILSSLPGGTYAKLNGTSMAAPHVAGLAALLLQASPALANDLEALSEVMITTAIPLGAPIPNNHYGHGRIDAYNAVMGVAAVGTLGGTVTRAGNKAPIGNATLRITPHGGGPTVNTRSNSAGTYLQGVAPATYDVTASAFGYLASTRFNLVITAGSTAKQNFSLTPGPTGLFTGIVREAGSNKRLIATISINGAPAQTTSAGNGSFSLNLPVGVYTATVAAPAHRVAKVVNITINDGSTFTKNVWLDLAPKILLVDSGKWYQDSQISYYRQALNDLLYPYDLWQIAKPFEIVNDIPPLNTLKQYDIVIWSAPADAPGYIGAGKLIEDYLKGGGKLLLSGQDVAYYDGGGGFSGIAPYLRNYLNTIFLEDNSNNYSVTGAGNGPFNGLSFEIEGGDGANNQVGPDLIALTGNNAAGPLLSYMDQDNLAGVHVAVCVPYRAIYLPFGFEAISTRANRVAVMERTLDWLKQTPPQRGLELTPAQTTRTGNFGQVISHTVRVRNIGAKSDLFSLSLSAGTPYNWSTTLISPTLSLPACQARNVTINVHVPPATTWNISDTFTLTVKSTTHAATVQTVSRRTKTPAPVLLVDDDREYSFATEFKKALAANNIPYDYWRVPKSWVGEVPSPPLTTLQMYPMVIWYTGSDWFHPLTTPEEERLASYLDKGGRLFLSSQDYIYNLPGHKPSPFAQKYLGVLAHREDFSSTLVTGKLANPVGDNLGPYVLTFPLGYENWTDALTPTASAQVATTGQSGQVNGLTNAGVGPGGKHWHTTFLSYGPELLAAPNRVRLLQRSLGWLSWLGRSTVTPSISAALDGQRVVYTATLLNDGPQKLNTAYFTATFPAELTLDSHAAGLTPSGGALVWSGSLNPHQPKVFTYSAKIANSLPLGTAIKQVNWLAYPEHNLLFDRIATVKTNFPDLSPSSLKVVPTQAVEAGDMLTYTITLKNSGLVDDPLVTVTNKLPALLEWVAVDDPSRGQVISNGRNITWTTSLSKNSVARLTYRARISYEINTAIENTAYVDDGFNEPNILSAWTSFEQTVIYLPTIFKGN